jgi:hypothetical protein
LINFKTAASYGEIPLSTIYWAVKTNLLETQEIAGKKFTTRQAVDKFKAEHYTPRPRQ